MAEGCIVHHGKFGWPMSALGHKRTFQVRPMSALPPKADWSSVAQCPAICGGRLVDLDSDRRDDRRPFGDLGFDEVAEFFWR